MWKGRGGRRDAWRGRGKVWSEGGVNTYVYISAHCEDSDDAIKDCNDAITYQCGLGEHLLFHFKESVQFPCLQLEWKWECPQSYIHD